MKITNNLILCIILTAIQEKSAQNSSIIMYRRSEENESNVNIEKEMGEAAEGGKESGSRVKSFSSIITKCIMPTFNDDLDSEVEEEVPLELGTRPSLFKDKQGSHAEANYIFDLREDSMDKGKEMTIREEQKDFRTRSLPAGDQNTIDINNLNMGTPSLGLLHDNHQLKQELSMKNLYIAGLTHDLRNMLHVYIYIYIYIVLL